MKGIILAAGAGTRLFPITRGIPKALMAIYDKPMIYYPLGTLMMAGIKDILIIVAPHEIDLFKRLLGDGAGIGIHIEYAVQEIPKGTADAFIIGEKFIGQDDVALVFGDNVFHSENFSAILKKCLKPDGGIVFSYQVSEPSRYGVVEFDENMKAISIEEKPTQPKSSYAVTGLYFYDNSVIDIAKSIKPSIRGEIEVPDINSEYLNQGRLRVEVMDPGSAWLDTGTFDSMNDASEYIRVIEKRTGLKIGCIEEIAYRQGYINKQQLKNLAEPLQKSGYGEYLIKLVS